MSAVDDLVAFLRQCLDRDEQVIREAARDYFYAEGHGDAVNRWFDRWSPDSPDGMIAEVEAKRRVLDEILQYEAGIDGERGCCHSAEAIAAGHCPDTKLSDIPALRFLAQPYAGWPGWREEWTS